MNQKLEKFIDHTILKPDATGEEVIKLCKEAKEYGFASVCVNPSYTALVSEQLRGCDVLTCVVIGFPLGANTTLSKVNEAKECISLGARELDMVIHIGAVKSADWDYVKNDIEQVCQAAKGKAVVKVIIETCLLADEEKIKVCQIAAAAGADFVKTSTGFSKSGATVEDIRLMRKTVGESMGVKASGGVRDYAAATAMIEAGATRIGTSNGISIVEGKG